MVYRVGVRMHRVEVRIYVVLLSAKDRGAGANQRPTRQSGIAGPHVFGEHCLAPHLHPQTL